jgi:glucan-binding YG repeat protein
MKKRCLTVLALAALMTLGTAGMTAMAAEGWTQENGLWVYYNAAGNKITDAWRKGSDGYWRYLDGSGYMATSAWVDDEEYYVDASGIMLANQWVQVEDSEKKSGYSYYYLGESGKVTKNKWLTINGKKYHFDDDGVMETGWILDDMYYCDENGVMLTGWQKLYPPDSDEDDYQRNSTNTPYYDDSTDDGREWFNFGTSGKKVVLSDSSADAGTKTINGATYVLNSDGAAQFGWVCTNGDSSTDIQDYRLTDSSGKVMTGWLSAYVPDDLRSNYEYDVEWFYFNSKGVPQVGPMKGAATTSDLKRINGYTYLFDDDGVPVYGLQKVYSSSNSDNYSAYYFGTVSQRAMMKGKYKIDDEQYYFSTNGKGYTGVYENYLYYRGKLQKASSGTKYEVFSIPSDTGSKITNYVVNTSGRVAKNTTVKDSDGTKYKTSSSGVLLKEDDEDVGDNVYTMPEEPEFDYN